jgi:hypothetical protein
MSDNEHPPQPPSAEAISINFRDQHNNEITFKLKGSTKLGKAFDAFSARVEREPAQLRFLFDGTRLQAEDTVGSVSEFQHEMFPTVINLSQCGIEDGDTVDVHMEQIGGSFPVTQDADQEWVLVSSEDDEASAKRLQEENEALKDRLDSLERSAPRNAVPYAVNAVYTLDANRRGGKIQLHLLDHRNAKVTFKLSNTTRLRRAINIYSDRVCVPVEKIDFRWNSHKLSGDLTPFEVGRRKSRSFEVQWLTAFPDWYEAR